MACSRAGVEWQDVGTIEMYFVSVRNYVVCASIRNKWFWRFLQGFKAEASHFFFRSPKCLDCDLFWFHESMCLFQVVVLLAYREVDDLIISHEVHCAWQNESSCTFIWHRQPGGPEIFLSRCAGNDCFQALRAAFPRVARVHNFFSFRGSTNFQI